VQCKVLFISTSAYTSQFNLPFMRWFQQQGWQVDYVSDGEIKISDCDNQYAIPIKRSPYNYKNITAYRELKKILINDYDIIHCHTPMGGVLARLAARKIKTKTWVIYTAHGFHFYNGAPLINWLLYYSVEKYFSGYTDALITINNEDYNIALRKFFSCKNIHKIDGVGVALDRFKPYNKNDKKQLRKDFNINESDFVILYVAEFIPRKNHKILINSIKRLTEQIKHLKILFAGIGPFFEKYKKQIDTLELSEIVHFLGFRRDIEKLCNIADIGVSPSKQEGLPIGVVEYISSGLPIVCSRIRGHIDVVVDRQNGLLFDLNKPNQMFDAIIELYSDINLRKVIIQNNLNIREKYSLNTAIAKMAEIYKQCGKF